MIDPGPPVNHQAVPPQCFLEQLPLGRTDTTNAQALAKHQSPGDDELLFVDGHDQYAIFFSRLLALADRLAHRLVLDLDFFAIRVDLESSGHLVDLGVHCDLADLAQLFVRD